MRKITKFPKLVIDEAKNLKKFATPEELANLDIDNFYAISASNCIYGQMTGSCYSPRATELIKQCAKRVYKGDGSVGRTKLNGSPKNFNITHRYTENPFWSPIESFIAKASDEMNHKLIAFLKGERKRLV